MSLARGSIVLIAVLTCLSPAGAVSAPPLLARPSLGNMVDARVNYKQAYERATAVRGARVASGLSEARTQAASIATAIAKHRASQPGLEVRLSNLTGAPSAVRSKIGPLTGPAPGRSSEDIVRDFLRQYGDVYGLSSADAADLVALGDSPGGTSGLRMLRLEQQIDGRPVFQSETRFLLDREGRLMKTLGLMVPHARAFAGRVDPASLMLPEQAVVRLLEADGKTAVASSFAVAAEENGRMVLSENDGFVAGPIAARQVLFPLAPGLLVPAWSLVVFTEGDQDWYAIVDAETGDVLWRKNIRDYASAHDARFRVYVQADGTTPADSPAPQSPDTAVPGGGTQYPEIAPTVVSMHTAMDPVASPNGWIDDCPAGGCTANETQTLGNNAVACLDRTVGGANTNACDTDVNSVLDGSGKPMGNPDSNSRNRDFLGTTPRDFQTGFIPPPQGGNPEAGQSATNAVTATSAAENSFRRGVVTHLFYVVNWYHDQLFKLGFDEAAGNFQRTNFSGMGLGNDRVNADAEDGGSTNNANFSTPPDGTSGRAQMYRFTGPTIDRDGDLDQEVLMHELTHGTSNRLVGNAAGLNWDPARGMGEGWSDFVALSLLNNTNADNPVGQYASGAYATYKFLGLLDNYVYGIRRFPYTPNHAINPMTWADVDDVTYNTSGGIPETPIPNFSLAGAMEVHNSGEIWALTLWGVRSRIILDPVGANGNVPAGNHTMLQLVINGLKMTPINPSFTDARNAIIDADCATNACANEQSIWDGFADRGLGYGAHADYNVIGRYVASHEGVHESFTSPVLDVVDPLTDVTIDDSADNNNGAVDPGEAVKLTVKLTNPWRGAGKAVTGGTATLTTSTPGVTIYDNTASFGAIAPQGTAVAGDSFTITVDPSVVCGSAIDFTLSTTSNIGTTSTTFRLRVGNRNGTDAVVTYTGDPNPDLTITNGRPRGVFHQINVTDDFEIADVNFRLDSVTHPGVGDLTAMLRSPGGIGVDMVMLIDGLNDLGGTSIVNMVIDDDVVPGPTTDMVEATTADAPYTRSWLPVYNSPWAALVNPALPADPVGNLTPFNGLSTKGTWSTLMADVFTASQGGTDGNGTFNAWSILVTPVHFDCVAFVASAAVTATKTVTGTFRVGGTVTYTVTLTNNGTANQADNAGHEFTDTLPAGLTLVSATATSGTAATAGNTVNWDGSLAPLGGSVTITITATVNAGAQGTTISNQGTASFDSNNDGTNDATASTDDPGVGGATDPTVFAVANAAVTGTKTVSGTFKTGGTVTYTIVLSNSGSSASPDNPGNELTDAVPAGLTVVSATATSGTAANAGNNVTWNGSIPAAGSVTLTITATVNAGAQGTTQCNQASFAFDADLNGTNESTGTTDDPAVGGANDPTCLAVQGVALSATKTASGTFVTGSTVTYTVVISNTGNTASLDTPASDEFTDVLPASLTLVNATATSGTATPSGNTVTWNGTIPAGGTVTITITATINVGFAQTTVSNQGRVSFDSDLDGTNDTTVQTDDPAVGGASDPTTFVVSPATAAEVPTLSEWGLALLGLSLLLAGWSVMRRRTERA
ncbi:MAG: IPTL-CTERM sorting domain-containing protein [Acidobacteria bacterium]|nr:IPTL-CTERM sorting domain-containing protein [Acidobacteriota bacterium]